MEIKITREKENPVLNRKEIRFTVQHEGATPTRRAVKERLAALLDSQPDQVMVEKIKPRFGMPESEGYAKIYESAERAREVERKHIIKRNVPKAEAEEE